MAITILVMKYTPVSYNTRGFNSSKIISQSRVICNKTLGFLLLLSYYYIIKLRAKRSFFVKILIKNPHILRDDKTISADILIEDGIISAISPDIEPTAAPTVIDGAGKLAIPALINCHTHSYMSVFRNIADDLPFDSWLFDRILPLEDMLTPQDAYYGCLLSFMEMIRSGTGTFCDMHMFPGVLPKAIEESGLRGVVGRGLAGGGNDPGGFRRLTEALDEYNLYKDNPGVLFMLAPHAVYSCDRDYLTKIIDKAKSLSLPIHIHLSESIKEVEDCKRAHGVTPVEYLDSLGLFEVPTLAAHCVHVTDNDLDIMARNKVSVVTNLKSNLKLANGVPPIPKMLDKGINVCLGTDGAASNNSQNLFSELNFLSLVHKGITKDATAIPASQAFDIATTNGAKALGIKDLGLIKEGYKADIALLDMSEPSLNPGNNPLGALVYSATGHEVDTLLVEGRVLLSKGEFVSIDKEEVLHNIARITKKFGI